MASVIKLTTLRGGYAIPILHMGKQRHRELRPQGRGGGLSTAERGPRAQPSASHTFSSRRPALSTQRACASHGGLGHVLAGAVSGVWGA